MRNIQIYVMKHENKVFPCQKKHLLNISRNITTLISLVYRLPSNTLCLQYLISDIMLQKTFLYRVYQKDKALFTFFVLFILGQLFFTYKHIENTPFFHFGMYSAIHHPHDSYTVYNIAVSETPVKSLDFPDHQREIVYNTLATYDGLKQMNFDDTLNKVISHRLSGATAEHARAVLLNTAQIDTPYQEWLLRYIADMRMVKTPLIEVARLHVSYQPDGTLAAQDTAQTLFKLRYE